VATAIPTANVAITELVPYGNNPRRGNVEAIKVSLRENGQYRPIVVRRSTREVLAGNHTLEAARQLGWSEIAVTFVDCDEEQAKRIVLADNRTNDLAGYDDEALLELLLELPSLDGTGYHQEALDDLLDEVGADPLGDEEPVPSPPRKPKTRPGHLYALGPHHLLCGDARSAADYRRLLDDQQSAILWTDPPYGVEYEGKTAERLSIAGDGADGLSELLQASFAAVDSALRPGAPLYVCHPAGVLSLPFTQAFVEQGWSLRQSLVWVKDSMVLGRSDHHYKHEAILYGFKPGKGRLGRGGRGWYGGNAEVSVFEVPRPTSSPDHPTMKPPELIEAALRNSSRRREIVLDPFAGSGSTLVAAERTGRVARLIELDPRYCDVIVARWELLTGQTAELVAG
jgi:DNA modification methylase